MRKLDITKLNVLQGCKEAAKHANKSKELLCKFWQYVIKESVEEIPRTISNFNQETEEATDIFETLLARFPRSTQVYFFYLRY